MKYRAFLSYSHADRNWARWLHRRLENYRPPKTVTATVEGAIQRRLNPIFRDRDELPSTASLSNAVQAALRDSEWLIVICSPDAAASRWVNEEIRAFRALGRTAHILCFIVAGEPGALGDGNCFPEALTAPESSGGIKLEPVAADARPEGDGRGNAMLKIAAGMLGVGFDALRQRDLKRRHRRLIAIAAGSLAVAALTIVLAISAVLARNEAQQRRAEAEDLIDFMLGDLRAQLRKIGRLDVFQSVGDKALEYFAAQRDGYDSPRMLSQRAMNLRQIGEVRLESGDPEAALEAFSESLHITEGLAEGDPQNAEAQIDLANSRFYVGYVHWQRGELGEARAMFESVIPIVDAVSALDANHPPWLAERAYANTNLGRLAELQGDLDAALVAYQAVMDVNKRLVALEPDNSEWGSELGFAHNNLGKLFVSLGRLDEAEVGYRKDLEIKKRLYDADPAHNVHRSYLAVSQYYLGQLLVMRGDYADGESQLSAAREHFAFLIGVDSDRNQWRQRQANIERELGKIRALSGAPTEGQALFTSSAGTLEELVEGEPLNSGRRRDLVRSLLMAADIHARNGAATGARDRLREAEPHIATLIEQEPSIVESYELSAYAAICRARTGDGSAATAELETALEVLDRYFPDSRDPRILELRAAALSGLADSATPAMVKELRAIGYEGLGLVAASAAQRVPLEAPAGDAPVPN